MTAEVPPRAKPHTNLLEAGQIVSCSLLAVSLALVVGRPATNLTNELYDQDGHFMTLSYSSVAPRSLPAPQPIRLPGNLHQIAVTAGAKGD